MSELESAFEKVTGQQPTDADVQHLYRIKNALRLGNNDSLWLMLMAFQYHTSLYEKFPDEIAKASTHILTEFRTTADATARASAQTAQADLANAVATVAHKVADDVVVKKKLQWAVGAIVALVVFACVTLFLGYRAGVGAAFKDVTDVQSAATWEASGKGLARSLIWTVPYGLGDDGSDLAVVRASDAAWLNSADGHQAQALSQAGTLHWGEWLSAVVDSGLLSERKPDRNSCQDRTVMGFKWSLFDSLDGGSYCNVWQGRVLFLTN